MLVVNNFAQLQMEVDPTPAAEGAAAAAPAEPAAAPAGGTVKRLR